MYRGCPPTATVSFGVSTWALPLPARARSSTPIVPIKASSLRILHLRIPSRGQQVPIPGKIRAEAAGLLPGAVEEEAPLRIEDSPSQAHGSNGICLPQRASGEHPGRRPGCGLGGPVRTRALRSDWGMAVAG